MNTTQKTITLLAILLILLGAGAAFSLAIRERTPESQQTEVGLTVATATYILEEIARAVGGTHINVISMAQPGVEAHDFEPTARQVKQIHDATLFVYNGEGLDPWATKLAPQVAEKGVRTLAATSVIADDLLEADGAAHEHEEGEEDDLHADEDAHTHDPHTWLNPLLLVQQVEALEQQFAEVDPSHADAYHTQATSYIERLRALDAKYMERLAQCGKREIVVSHNAFSYLAERYDIDIHSIRGITPESEPSSKHIAELTEIAKNHQIEYIFFETLANPKLSETIAREVGAKTAVLNPIEGLTQDEQKNGDGYISVMEKNLDALTLAMQCQ